MDFTGRIVTMIGLSALLLSACGVKAPPLPPEPSTPAQSDQNQWSPQRAAPSPTPRNREDSE